MAAEPVINKLLEQVLQGQDLTRNDMLQLLSLEDPEEQVSYEHLVVTGDTLLCKGERVMSETGPLQHRTVICGDAEALAEKRAAMMEGIRSLQKGVKR